MQIVIDLDGTICTEEKQYSRSLARPMEGVVEALKHIKSQGYTIIIYSARTWSEYEMTVDWLSRHEILFDQLILGKPQGDYWIDDRAIEFKGWSKVLEKLS
jgi:capsule biosynthesis phosphatase